MSALLRALESDPSPALLESFIRRLDALGDETSPKKSPGMVGWLAHLDEFCSQYRIGMLKSKKWWHLNMQRYMTCTNTIRHPVVRISNLLFTIIVLIFLVAKTVHS